MTRMPSPFWITCYSIACGVAGMRIAMWLGDGRYDMWVVIALAVTFGYLGALAYIWWAD